MEKVSVIRLGCVGCGASLDIRQDVKQLACSHCGTSQIVERTGGSVHLRELAHTLSRVQVGTDKTAAELAIARLTRELEQLTANRRNYENQMYVHRNSRAYFWQRKLASEQQVLTIVVCLGGGVAGFLGIFFGIMVGAALGPLIQKETFPLIVLLVAGLFGLAGLFGTYWIYIKFTRYSRKDLIAERNQELDSIKAEFNTSRMKFDREVREYNERIKKNSEIANS